MRRHLQKFLPVVLIALMVQILVPIAACWAAAVSASDPLQGAEICHGAPVSLAGGQGDQGGDHRTQDGACPICCLAHANTSFDTPQNVFATPYRQAEAVLWPEATLDLFTSRSGSNSQARAPPASM